MAHNYGRSGIGWPSEVSQITATEAMAFHKKYYVGANIVVAVVGDVKAAEAMPMLEKYFSKVPGGPKPEDLTTVEPKQFAEKSVVIREQTQPFYIEGYHRPSYRDPDDAVYDAISDIMSNGRVSRLYRSLVQRPADCGRGSRVSAHSPATSIPACLRSMRFRCRGIRRRRCATPFTRRSTS